MSKLAYFLIFLLSVNAYADNQKTYDAYSKQYENTSTNLLQSGVLNNKVNPSDYSKDYSANPKEENYYSNSDQMAGDSVNKVSNDQTTKKTLNNFKDGAYKSLVNPNSPMMQHASDIMQYSYEYSHGISTDKFDCKTGKACRWSSEIKSCEISQDFTTSCTRTPIVKVDNELVSNCKHYLINGLAIQVLSGADSKGFCQIGIESFQLSGFNQSLNDAHHLSIQAPANLANVNIVLFAYLVGQFENTSASLSESITSLGNINLPIMYHVGYYENVIHVPQSTELKNYSLSISAGLATGRGQNTLRYGTFIEYPQSQPVAHVTGWQSNCQIPDTSQCSQTSESCAISGSTRYFNGVPLYQSCWQYNSELTCSSGHVNTCDQMADCDPEGQSCIQSISGNCTRYKRDYSCPVHVCDGGDVQCGSLGSDIINDRDNPQESQEDFDQAVSGLAAASAAGNGIKDQNTLEPEIFKGQSASCGKAGLDVYDCCDNDGNILMHCSADDQALKKARDKGITTYVGEYCDKKDPTSLVCLVTRKSYCVFPSKLDRIVQEQGRVGQLGISFGDPKSPDCRGLSIDEFQKLDLSTMDLSGIYDDLTIASPSQSDLSDKMSNDYNNTNAAPDFNNTANHQAKPEEGVDPSSTDSYAGRNR